MSVKLTTVCFFLILYTLAVDQAYAQTNTPATDLSPAERDELFIKKLYDTELRQGDSYEMLRYLAKNIGGRLSGSPQADMAVDYTKKKMMELGFDSVYLQEVMVPHWVRGDKEEGKIVLSNKEEISVPICALGGSVATTGKGLTAPIIEVIGIEGLKRYRSMVKDKIVFFNEPMDPTHIFTFKAYSQAVNQRTQGAIEAAKLGALGVVVRSLNLALDDYPHTGVMKYEDGGNKIPAVAISTNGAELLSSMLKKDKQAQFFMRLSCQTLPDARSYNVIGELRGSEHPEEIIVVGGHLDAWDLGEGAHDDGAGCIQAIEVLNLFKKIKYQPKRTIRAVMYMNEENGSRGANKYAELAKTNNEKHIAAIESDRGAFVPRGFSIDASDTVIDYLKQWQHYFEPYLCDKFIKGMSGADIHMLKDQGAVVMGYLPDPQRYFKYHHNDFDVFEEIDKRELELGAATMAAMTYLLSEYGIAIK